MPTEDPTGSRRLGLILVAGGGVLISLSPIWVKLAAVGPNAASFYRTFLGGLILLTAVLIKRQKILPGLKQARWSLFCGFLFALDLGLWHFGVKYAEPGLSTILVNFQVFLMAAWGVLVLKERLAPRLALSMPLALTGLFFLVGIRWQGLGPDYKLGVLAALAGAAAYTAYILTLRASQGKADSLPPLANMALISLSCSIFCAFFVMAGPENFLPPDLSSWIYLFIYAAFSQAVGWVMISVGLPKIETSLAGMLLLTQPALAFVWDVIIFKGGAEGGEIIGAILALSAIYLGVSSRQKTG